MRLVPSRPTTIDSVRYGERWFPRMFRHTDGSLLLYIEYGHDRHFTPDFRLQSHDEGATWHTHTDNVPRACWAVSFTDGELFELDCYGVHDPKTQCESGLFAAWSNPSAPNIPVRKEVVSFNAPSSQKTPLKALQSTGYPTFPWWPLWNGLHNNPNLSGNEIHLLGPYVTTGLRLADDTLLAIGHWERLGSTAHKTAVFCYRSNDRGRNWSELSTVAVDDAKPEGVNEASMIQLRDGRLYVVIRTGANMLHTWSSDLGKTWTAPTEIKLIDEPGHRVGLVWPVLTQLENGTLVLVYGRPGKNIVVDPTGTGTQWQARLDLHAWELDTQALMGVPKENRLDNSRDMGERYWNSGDYLFAVPTGPDEVLVGYDVQHFQESWNTKPFSGVRMLRVKITA